MEATMRDAAFFSYGRSRHARADYGRPRRGRGRCSARFMPLAAALVLLAGVAGCAHSGAEARGPQSAEPFEPEVRIGICYGPRVTAAFENRPTPLFYGAGFLTKIQVFETLVGMDAAGAPTPALAERWEISADGRAYTFHIRPNARFHDGRPCDAAAVAAHFKRLGSDEDMFIGAFHHIVSVEPVAAHAVRFVLNEPYPLLEDLPLPNPMAVVVPEAPRDAEPAVLIGTGPFRFAYFAPMRRCIYERFDEYDGRRPAIASFSLEIYMTGFGRSNVLPWALERGYADAIVESWVPSMSRVKAKALGEKPGFERLEDRGSAVVLLACNLERPPFDDIACRRFIAACVDRAALVDYAEQGFADPVDTIFAPGVADWPDRKPAPPADAGFPVPERLAAAEPVLVVGEDPASLLCAIELSRQLDARGVRVRIETSESGSTGWDRVNRRDYDLHLTRSWGLPYDPPTSLRARFMPQPVKPTAVETVPYYTHPDLTRLIRESYRSLRGTPERKRVYREIQERVDRDAVAIPLFMSRRIALMNTRAVQGIELGQHGYDLDLSGATVK